MKFVVKLLLFEFNTTFWFDMPHKSTEHEKRMERLMFIYIMEKVIYIPFKIQQSTVSSLMFALLFSTYAFARIILCVVKYQVAVSLHTLCKYKYKQCCACAIEQCI